MTYEDKTQVEVIQHTKWNGTEIITFRGTFPQIIHKHLLKHRLFSQEDSDEDASISTSSIRAIPGRKQIDLVMETPFVPQRWPKNRSGMQATEYYEGTAAELCEEDYLAGFMDAVTAAERLLLAGVHKAIALRGLEPYGWATAMITTTLPGLQNFLALRDHPEAQDETAIFARCMRKAYEASSPFADIFHIPFRRYDCSIEDAMIYGVAQCARTSYGRELDAFTMEQNRDLMVKLLTPPIHSGPTEHVGIFPVNREAHLGNFEVWNQLRHRWREYLPSIAARLE